MVAVCCCGNVSLVGYGNKGFVAIRILSNIALLQIQSVFNSYQILIAAANISVSNTKFSVIRAMSANIEFYHNVIGLN